MQSFHGAANLTIYPRRGYIAWAGEKGNPTYVAVWREERNEIRLVEVIYAGTHEKAPY